MTSPQTSLTSKGCRITDPSSTSSSSSMVTSSVTSSSSSSLSSPSSSSSSSSSSPPSPLASLSLSNPALPPPQLKTLLQERQNLQAAAAAAATTAAATVAALEDRLHGAEAAVLAKAAESQKLERQLMEMQSSSNDTAFQLKQRTAEFEDRLLLAEEAAAQLRRDLESKSRTTARLEVALKESEAFAGESHDRQMEIMNALRKEIRSRDGQIQFLKQHLEAF
eukprot:CAMPEP_0175057522 /NCGR_PEP_ID=MMETSP0052_2-20121109/11308_1 /TAXON_ID=51329 ORGANISM="Polytomella parva, Strain SAG 63-3" /NCGR_SAMPLE_ID=MMETSP0052_2 /ASSEMBLY_ACC=CAM_ASM_000194 /LENGTH=221 /DNA_ID=CAMNT_0016322739 /DNA_START=141 /DNA_END=803 /DNA_ORIENTATION=-